MEEALIHQGIPIAELCIRDPKISGPIRLLEPDVILVGAGSRGNAEIWDTRVGFISDLNHDGL